MKLENLFKYIKDKKNVIGYSNHLQHRIKNGREFKTEEVFRVYVEKKVPINELDELDFIPEQIKKVNTDIIEIGKLEVLKNTYPDNFEEGKPNMDRTSRFRPVPLGVSVGNVNITAGSFGMIYTDSENNEVVGSNAHVISDLATHYPHEVIEKRIVQPGKYHDSDIENNIVGHYKWHDKIITLNDNECPIANLAINVLNIISQLLGRKSRFKLETETKNHQDFGVYTPTEKHVLEVPNASLENKKFIGHLFAGSDTIGVICKVKYAIESGYYPLIEPAKVKVDDEVEGHSFWGDYLTQVTDDSATIQVSGYNNSIAWFEDIILVKNEKVIVGGWSGSGFYKLES